MTNLIIGCGYVGQAAARLLLGRGERVLGTTRSAERAESLAALGVEPIVADMLDIGSLERLPAADRVLHCVGFDRGPGRSMRDVQVEGLANVLKALEGRCGRSVLTSSTGVYGQTDGRWVDEDSRTEPFEESGRVCLEAEAAVFGAAGLSVSVVRFSGLYGPGRIIRRSALLAGEPIEGDPDRWLNLIHRDDAARAAVAVLDRGRAGRVYLASDDRPVTRREYYELAARCLEAPGPRFVGPGQGGHPGATGANKRVSNRRLREELGVELAYPDVGAGLPAVLAVEADAGRQSAGAGSM